MHTDSPFHAGEQAVQNHLGVREAIEPWARKVVRGWLPEEHQAFYSALPFVVLAARDDDGRPWASVLTGAAGFLSPTRATLGIDAQLPDGDALAGALTPGHDVGLLGIELETRRRNRVNGHISARTDGGFVLTVGQSFGNCPQYIQPRRPLVQQTTRAAPAVTGSALTPADRQFITRADTCFIASGVEQRADDVTHGMDASHRGGPAGFVEVVDERTLRLPDYAGNNHFNTLGNLAVDPRIGLLFIDFERGSMLQVSGRAEINWSPPATAGHAAPGERVLRTITITVDRTRWLAGALPLRWERLDDTALSLTVTERHEESPDIVSLTLSSGSALPDFHVGQYLPVVVPQADGDDLLRTYSLSRAPDGRHYRISVMREPGGRASGVIHDQLAVGDRLKALPPAGDFVLEDGSDPVVLLGAGVGVTPLLAMLERLSSSADPRPVWFVQVDRGVGDIPFDGEVERLVNGAANARRLTFLTAADDPARALPPHGRSGRPDARALLDAVGTTAADFYLCGPTGFMSALSGGLEALGVEARRLHSESFGPAAGPTLPASAPPV